MEIDVAIQCVAETLHKRDAAVGRPIRGVGVLDLHSLPT